ncbi:MAG TPA: sialidase family protein [Sedimentisphaerales bacterium]|nr:sialidase family protein [Sedimentisphaerales bacterium]
MGLIQDCQALIRTTCTLATIILTAYLHSAATADTQTLLVIEPTSQQPRNSEGDIVQLKDGRLCLVYSRFTGGTRDHSTADLAMRTSSDNGKTWTNDKILVPNEGKCNVMSVSILRLKNGELLLFYLRKEARLRSCSTYVRRSTDEFETLSPPVRVTLLEGYHVVNNDRAVQLSTGRLIVPAALHTGFDETGTKVTDFSSMGIPIVYYSDDDGRSWHKSNTAITPVSERKSVLQEPGVVEIRDGRLWMFMRTTHGFQYGCYSSDGGITWSEPTPTSLASPCSPATIERIPWSDDLLCVWNDHSGAHPFQKGKRTPLCVAISKDDGRTWSKSRIIEADPNGWFCYTSMSFVDNRALLSYCAGDKQVGGLNRLKVLALSKDWLYPPPSDMKKRH